VCTSRSRFYLPGFLLASALTFNTMAAAADPAVRDLAGEYSLASSSTAPQNGWGYSKARLSVRKLDDKHVILLLACQWKREPKAVCADYFYAQQRPGGVYLQDMNTDLLHIYFYPRTRTLTMISRGLDAKESVRRDVFTPTNAPLTDPALMRRMKREQSNAESKESLRVFGLYSKWSYQNNRIDFQSSVQ
jgi:hypothetical protein